MPTAFLFAGGGSLGAVQVGMLKALASNGVQADLVVGASVGAVNAAYFATDPTAEGVARLEAIWRRIQRREVFPAPTVRGVMRLIRGRSHLLEADGLRRMLEREFAVRDFAGLTLPCTVVATDLLDGLPVHIQSGPLVPALLASTSIPGVFPPVTLGSRVLVDGGLATGSPLAAAIALGATRLLVLPTGYSCARRTPPTSAAGVALQGLNILTVGKLIATIREYRARVTIDVVPPLCPLDVSPVDFAQTAALIERAEQSTARWLAQGGDLVDGFPHQLPVHGHTDPTAPYAAHLV
ncbi:MAG: patatin-like phospholipase family protein [Steroidobacteraceae bacterium]|nr:patatin-like phospholipase family protein [Steroidobacteraceae bacterium]